MRELDETLLVGTGLHRKVYEDPLNSDCCIKVVVNGDGLENRRELAYYRKLQKQGNPWDVIPRYYGQVETNLGEGEVFHLVRDHDGMVSRTLEQVLSDPGTRPDVAELERLLKALREALLEQGILTMTVKPKNIMLQRRRDEPDRLVVIDNLGCSELIPVSSHIRYFARRKTARRFDRFEAWLWKKFYGMAPGS